MQNKPVVFFVFYLWSTIEIFRLAQIAFLLSPVEDMSLVLTLAQPPLHQIPVLHAGLHQHRVEDANVAAVHHLDSSLPAGSHSWRLVILWLASKCWCQLWVVVTDGVSFFASFLFCFVFLHLAVAVIQSLPIFDETRLFSLPLPEMLGNSLSFSYTLQLYLVFMFLGKWIYHHHVPPSNLINFYFQSACQSIFGQDAVIPSCSH